MAKIFNKKDMIPLESNFLFEFRIRSLKEESEWGHPVRNLLVWDIKV